MFVGFLGVNEVLIFQKIPTKECRPSKKNFRVSVYAYERIKPLEYYHC